MGRPTKGCIVAVAVSLLLGGFAGASDKNVGGTAAGALTQAATEVSFLSFDRALPLFDRALSLSALGSDEWQAASFGRATCLNHIAPATDARLKQAAAIYRELAEKFPLGKFAAPSMLALGRIDELVDYRNDKPDREAARAWYERAREAARGTPLADEATLRIAGSHIQLMTPESVRAGIDVLEKWLKQFPDNSLASAMWQYAGDSYLYPLEDERKALDCYVQADRIGLMERGREGPVYWRMAQLAERVKDRDTAIAYYTKTIVKTPTSGKAYQSQLALKRLGAPVPEISIFSTATTRPATRPAEATARVEKP
jgi:tetratricopeptide (TPR) repeat protein